MEFWLIDEMNIFLSADPNYVAHLQVVIWSLLKSQTTSLRFYVIFDGEASALAPVARLCEAGGHRFHVLSPPAALSKFPPVVRKGRAIGRGIYTRLLTTEGLPPTLDKVLYLDCDLIVRKNLEDLWNLSLGTHSIAASNWHSALRKPDFNKAFGGRYFNSGVMLMNLKVWRERELSARCVEFFMRFPKSAKFFDQCVLNYVCTDWAWVSPAWNFSDLLGVKPTSATAVGMSMAELSAIAADPAVFHFVGAKKPWTRAPGILGRFDHEYWALRAEVEAKVSAVGQIPGLHAAEAAAVQELAASQT